MSNRPEILFVFPAVFFIAGIFLPVYLIGLKTDEIEWGERTAIVMYISLLILIAWPISKFQKRNASFKYWTTDTVLGVSAVSFAYSFIISLIVCLYLLLPISGLILFALSIGFSFGAFFAFMEMGRVNDS
ncbi:hypothetical protein PHACT_10100 [Pseudohongiella acticola]|uniref:Uncharacterized protein n=1 Tax=Pseudohongiella acticola TaxID=1524254 RepID=A0A1E8CMB5_9GAMM|nr:hypothetical protein PHACT_10100 [Pseudohongiella acticola]